jgi:Na+-driven multidrug efflux pump
MIDRRDHGALGLDRLKKAGRLTGLLVLLVGLGHLVLVVLLFAGPIGDIVSDGVIAAVPFDERASTEAAAVWFTVNGVLLIMLGQLARAFQAGGTSLPPSPGWLFIGLGVAGAAVAPISGFYVYVALGALWVSDSGS